MGGHALNYKQISNAYLMPSTKLIVIGHDTDHVQGSHPLWRADCDSKPEKAFVDSIRKHGFIQPVRARKLPNPLVLKDGTKIEANDSDYAEVVVGRERVKSGRILDADGDPRPVPVILYPANTPIAEIIGAGNAENSQRKIESVITQAEGVFSQMRALGYGDGGDELACAKEVSVSTGMSVQRIRNLLEFRSDEKLVKAVRAKENGRAGLNGEAALAIATLPQDKRESEIEKIIKDPSLGTTAQVRERVSIVKASVRASAPAKTGKKDGKSAKNPKNKNKKKPKKVSIGLSKALMQRIAESQMDLAPDDRDLDDLIIKAFKVAAGIAEPATVGGLMKAFKRLGLG